jgi:hypothetical protein
MFYGIWRGEVWKIFRKIQKNFGVKIRGKNLRVLIRNSAGGVMARKVSRASLRGLDVFAFFVADIRPSPSGHGLGQRDMALARISAVVVRRVLYAQILALPAC